MNLFLENFQKTRRVIVRRTALLSKRNFIRPALFF